MTLFALNTHLLYILSLYPAVCTCVLLLVNTHNGTMLLFTVGTQMEKSFLPSEKTSVQVFIYWHSRCSRCQHFFFVRQSEKFGFCLVDWHFDVFRSYRLLFFLLLLGLDNVGSPVGFTSSITGQGLQGQHCMHSGCCRRQCSSYLKTEFGFVCATGLTE